MNLYSLVLRAYLLYGGRANNEEITEFVSQERPEPREVLHFRLIQGTLQRLKRDGLVVNVVKGRIGQIGEWQTYRCGIASRTFNSDCPLTNSPFSAIIVLK